MTKQWWFLFFLGCVADGPSSIFVWWRLWQFRKTPGLTGWLAICMSLMALGHGLFTLFSIIAWFRPLTGFNSWNTGWSWSGRILLGLPLWVLGFVLFRDWKNDKLSTVEVSESSPD